MSSLYAFVRITLYLVVFLRQNRVAFYIQHLRDEWEEDKDRQRSLVLKNGMNNNQQITTTSVEKSILILKKLRDNNSLRGAQ